MKEIPIYAIKKLKKDFGNNINLDDFVFYKNTTDFLRENRHFLEYFYMFSDYKQFETFLINYFNFVVLVNDENMQNGFVLHKKELNPVYYVKNFN